MHAKRIDRNHEQIRRELRSIVGRDSVVDTHDLGRGFGDLIVGYAGVNYIFEIKMPNCELTDNEEYFHSHYGGQITVIENSEEALRAIGI